MNDGYEEILVKRGKTPKDTILKAVIIGVTAVLVAAGIFFFNPLFLLAGMALGLLGYYLILPNFDLEYEYLYVNGDFDIDKIMNKTRRKRVASYTLEEMEIIAPSSSHDLDPWRGKASVKDYTSGQMNKNSYTALYNTSSGQLLVMLELDEDVIRDIRRLAPRKISRDILLLH